MLELAKKGYRRALKRFEAARSPSEPLEKRLKKAKKLYRRAKRGERWA
jgi:hypothetical protein